MNGNRANRTTGHAGRARTIDSLARLAERATIIESLLDTDLYKLTTMQAVLHSVSAAEAEHRFHCRTRSVAPLAMELGLLPIGTSGGAAGRAAPRRLPQASGAPALPGHRRLDRPAIILYFCNHETI